MTVLAPEIPSQTNPAECLVSHPTACPSWCRDRHAPVAHEFGPSVTSHWGVQARLDNPAAFGAGESFMRAELYRYDAGSEVGATTMYVQGQTDVEMTAAEVDVLLVQAQAFVDTLRVLRAQMG
ncbi:DUF6907 domain-containing protein [Streptomyces natalensis]|uniref:Uncharacterized protein n=1 Tax=Streptomyces natalensis ATCC 27448 TaxID=1240678 RepID=A0A0D7CLY6_9ACTN|nr:hypothetical protein [Streptomyces natalensis]KIZ16865.1 hypothetical protein SNA_17920 [Streptomyces natalensis ATCC 27448]